jgi:hypothetical protein
MPMTNQMITNAIVLFKKNGVTRLILFVSALESPENAHDLDLACDGIGYWEMLRIASQLEDKYRINFDIIPLNPKNKFTEMVEQRGKILI